MTLSEKQLRKALTEVLPLFIHNLKPTMQEQKIQEQKIQEQVIQKAIQLYNKKSNDSEVENPIIKAINDLGKIMNHKGGKKKTRIKRKKKRKETRRKSHSKRQRGGWPPRYLFMIGLLLTTLLTQAAATPPAPGPQPRLVRTDSPSPLMFWWLDFGPGSPTSVQDFPYGQ